MKNNKFNHSISIYMSENITLYIFSVGLFVMGIIFGSLVLKSLSLNQEEELISYVSNFFYNVSIGEWQNSQVAFRQILFDNLKYLFFIWFLGLSIIGMPLIFLIIFMKGFVVGFTVSFFVSELGWKGFIFSLASIIPQNLLIVPVLIIAGVAGTLFSLSLIKSRGKNKTVSYHQSFISYSALILLLGLIIVIASAFEAFITPSLIKGVTTYIIKP